MTKNVTLRGIKEDNYNLFKQKAESKNITLSELFSQMISEENIKKTEENNEENIRLQEENTSFLNKIKELQSEIEHLKEFASSENNANNEENIRLQEENIKKTQEKTQLENQIETLQNQLQTQENIKKKQNDFLLNFAGFDLYMILLVCKEESERTGKHITPAILLEATFKNYVANNSFYFESPSYFKLKRLEKEFKEGKISINDFNAE